MGFIKRVTGPGVTERVNMVSADLGIVRYDPRRKAYAYVFGDNFAERYLRGEWQSPSIVMYDRDHNLLGIPAGTTDIVESGNRRQAIPYQHMKDGVSTMLPCDMILLRGVWYMAVMVVGLGGLGNELHTTFWQSPDLVNWTKTDPFVQLDHPGGHPGDVMLTFDRQGDWVYTFGTGGLARDKPIWMWRSRADEFPHGWFEPWGYDGSWAWGKPNENTPVLPGRYGELSYRVIQGHSVLSFFDVNEYSCSALTQPRPTDHWPTANRVDYARGPEVFQLYGGYTCDDSRLNEPEGMKFIVSQWNTGANDPYHVIAFHDTLQAQGPLVEVKPEPEPLPKPEPPTEGAMTPQELYELLLRELSASGSMPIKTPDGQSITLRQAVAEIYEKERCILDMSVGRPRHPDKGDDQLGHVLNSRAEGLFNQALLVALAEKAGIDAGKLYQQVQEALK